MSKIKEHIGTLRDWVHYQRLANNQRQLSNKNKQLGSFFDRLNQKIERVDFSGIEKIRIQLQKKTTIINSSGFGGGSRIVQKKKTIGRVARTVAVRRKYGRFLNALVCCTKSSVVLELGTSLGISAMYLAFENNVKVVTIEGNKALVNIARKTIDNAQLTNIELICGTFDDVLPEIITTLPDNALVYIDGNHTYEATIRYYKMLRKALPKGILIFDDIYWSKGMKKAWLEIAEYEKVVVDLFQFGIILNSEVSSGYYRVRY